MSPNIVKKMNSADADAETSCVAVLLKALPSASGWLSPYAAKPSMTATMSAKNSAISIPRIEATRLTTAFDERSELRNSRHLSQIKVSSWDIRLMIQNAYVGLGSNLGDRAGYLLLAVRGMLDAGLDIIRLSSIYETEPVEYEQQPAFLNMVAELRGATLPSPEQTLARLLRIEYSLGRTRDVPLGPRTIDLDLLIFKNERSDTAVSYTHLRAHE